MRLKVIIVILTVIGLCMFINLRPAMSDCTVDGVYQSSWGNVRLTQNGNDVTGTWTSGTVSGTREGDKITYTWFQGGAQGGKGEWTISPDCSTLTGPWGSGNNSSGGGNWDLHK